MSAILRKSAAIMAAVLALDQSLKIWVKTHMLIGESSWHDWGWSVCRVQLMFVEDATESGCLSAILPSIIKMAALAALVWYIWRLSRDSRANPMLAYCLALIAAGILGNLLCSMLYGMLFSESSAADLAEFLPDSGGYAPFMRGKAVNMLYFPIADAQWPSWMPVCGGSRVRIFSTVINIADLALMAGIALTAIFWKRLRIKG